MSLSDPIADMLTRIRNGQRSSKQVVSCPSSSYKVRVLDVLVSEGYIDSYELEKKDSDKVTANIKLKYHEGSPVIQKIEKVSKPGRRVYANVSDLPRVYNGLGIAIVSTSSGVMSDHLARRQGVGGEVICYVF